MQIEGSLGKFMMGHGLVCVLGKAPQATVEAQLVPFPLICTTAPWSSRQLGLEEVEPLGKFLPGLLSGLGEIIVYELDLGTEEQLLNRAVEERMC